MNPEDQKRDKYYQKRFGITLAEYDAILEEQGGCCAICGAPPLKNRLAVEHCHQWKYIKLLTTKTAKGWHSIAAYWGKFHIGIGPKKTDAIRLVRKQLQRASVRGLCCFGCNSGLRKIRNNPEFAAKMAAYLRKHQQPEDNLTCLNQ